MDTRFEEYFVCVCITDGAHGFLVHQEDPGLLSALCRNPLKIGPIKGRGQNVCALAGKPWYGMQVRGSAQIHLAHFLIVEKIQVEVVEVHPECSDGLFLSAQPEAPGKHGMHYYLQLVL